MDNYQDWTAGQHWQQALQHLDRANDTEDPNAAAVAVGLAQCHLVAARMLLDHPPVDPLDEAQIPGRQPTGDWRTQ